MNDRILTPFGLLLMLAAIAFAWLVERHRPSVAEVDDDPGYGEDHYFYAVHDDGTITEGEAEIGL